MLQSLEIKIRNERPDWELSDPAKQVTEKCPALKINELRIARPCKFHELRNVRTEKCPYFHFFINTITLLYFEIY